MSRSRRNKPIVGITTCRSEQPDKTFWHRKWRSRAHTALATASPEALSAHMPEVENQVITTWAMGKDGHRYVSQADQVAAAESWARRKGNSAQERAALKKRALRKAMAK